MLGGSPPGATKEVRMGESRLPIPERPWHRGKSGCWSLSLGVRGLKVRVQQHKPGGTFQRVYRVPGGRVTYASLGTTDREEARRLAIDFIRELEMGQMIHWAINERLPDGSWLLESNPLRGVKVPKEEDPRRPVATYDRFLKLREAAQDLAATAPQQRGCERWKRWEMALVLAEATGARIGAISGLRWSDIRFDPPEIKFRAEFDKRGRDRVVPIPEALAEELRGFKVKFAVVGEGWLFPCVNKDDHWPREVFGELFSRVERHARLPHLKGGQFHPFRRKWATERKNMSLVDVMAAGGWKDAQTLHSCYQLATPDGMLEVMSTPVKLRDRKVSST